jgi:hypothetical protein
MSKENKKADDDGRWWSMAQTSASSSSNGLLSIGFSGIPRLQITSPGLGRLRSPDSGQYSAKYSMYEMHCQRLRAISERPRLTASAYSGAPPRRKLLVWVAFRYRIWTSDICLIKSPWSRSYVCVMIMDLVMHMEEHCKCCWPRLWLNQFTLKLGSKWLFKLSFSTIMLCMITLVVITFYMITTLNVLVGCRAISAQSTSFLQVSCSFASLHFFYLLWNCELFSQL